MSVITASPGPEIPVELDLALSALALPALARPLTRAGHHTYAAVRPYVNRPVTQPPQAGRANCVSRELVLVRDDGQLIFDLLPQPGRPDAPLAARLIAGSRATCPCPMIGFGPAPAFRAISMADARIPPLCQHTPVGHHPCHPRPPRPRLRRSPPRHSRRPILFTHRFVFPAPSGLTIP